MKNLKVVFTVIFCSFFFSSLTNATTTSISQKVDTRLVYNIISKVNQLHLDVMGGSKKAKTQVWMYTPNTSSAQQWKFETAGEGYYYIKAMCSGMYLDIPGASKKSGTTVWQYKLNRTDAQKWKLIDAGDGYFYIQAKISGLYLDVQGGRKASKTPVWQYKLNRSDAQKWKLKPIKSKPQKLSNMNKAVNASLSGPAINEIKLFGHEFNFWKTIKVTKKGSHKVVTGRFSHAIKFARNDKYYFTATFDSKGKLISFERKIKEGFAIVTPIIKFVANELVGNIPVIGNQVQVTDSHIDYLAKAASGKLGKTSWEKAADEIALILAVAALKK